MNDPPSDGNENVIDIFIVSTAKTAALLLKEHLEQRDYRVTVFADGAQLIETLHAEKPNLLICDSTTGEQMGFEVCSQIKADDELFVIPVLILTAASTMEDLLMVLECNADNFIAPPYNLPDHLLLIEGMLTTPVERLTPDQIKKQFRVSHSDQTYVVAATRRKLLEYLLSSFEIAVSKSKELSHISSELQKLSEFAKELERSVTAQAQAIETVTATVQQKEQQIVALAEECERQEKTVVQKTDEIRNLVREREEVQLAHHSQTDELTSQVSTLAAESDTQKTSLDTVQHALIEETTRSASLEKTLHALRLEHEQQKTAYAAVKDRALSAEQKITGLDETTTQKAAELERLKEEMAAETRRRVLAETQAVSLKREFEQSERSYHSEIDTLNRKVGKLQEMLVASAAALENETRITASQKEHLVGFRAEKSKTDEQLASVLTQLAAAHEAVAAGELNRKSRADNLETVRTEKERSEQTTKTLSTALDQAHSDIEAEKHLRRTAEDTLSRTTREHDQAFRSLRQEYEGVQADLDSHNVTLAQREHDLAATTAVLATLEKDLDAAKTRNLALLEALDLAAQHRVQSGQPSHSSPDEPGPGESKPETERGIYHTVEEKTIADTVQQEDPGQDHRITHEQMDPAAAVYEPHRTQQPLSQSERVTTPNKNVQLVISKEPGLPVPVEHINQSITTELSPGLQQSPIHREDPSPGEPSGDIPRIFSGVIPRVSEISVADNIFWERDPAVKKVAPSPGPVRADGPAEEKTVSKYSPAESTAVDGENDLSTPDDDAKVENETVVEQEGQGDDVAGEGDSDETPGEPGGQAPPGATSFDRTQWLDLLKWARHSGALSQDQRLKIIRMGRLVQKGRKLTNKQ
ncbi:MAG: response regulator, partial [Methanomicrobiales archaeon]|nr:response regulator [Methanomicrobiales archaeon]